MDNGTDISVDIAAWYKLLTARAHTLAHYQVEHQVERVARMEGREHVDGHAS
jgi:hypothetical protein